MTPSFELTAIDRHFAEFIRREAGHATPSLLPVVSLASNAVGNGNICLDLADIAGRDIVIDGAMLRLPQADELKSELYGTGLIGSPGCFKPLVLDDDGRLYLYRYWQYERNLARTILAKAGHAAPGIDEALLCEGVARLFPGGGGGEADWQKIAALAAVRKGFCVISGGPGTGKTSTVVKIIALLLEQARGGALRIALAAPTGKSAARLKESIRQMKERLDCSAEVRSLIPEEVTTIHRLLGVRKDSVRFRHGEDNLLPHDIVIVDEASMVALPLMAKLAEALKGNARLILLGDRDQLASVEAGAALGDICGGGRQEPFSPGFVDYVARVAGERIAAGSPGAAPPLADSLVVLKRNYRFAPDSGIGAVARAVNDGDGTGAIRLLKAGSGWQEIPSAESLKRSLGARVIAGYGAYLAAPSPGEALRLFDGFRILCALRQGAYGVSGLNALVEEILAARGLIDPRSRWYPGRPVMITVNDYHLKLFNGDVGIVLPDPDGEGSLRVWFPDSEGGVRSVSPVRLPAHETVYAMTIHKSQGSEFDRVLMLMPGHDSEALTRELVYTGLTRAKSDVEVWGGEELFCAAVSRRIVRKSGLRDALWQGADLS